MTKVAFGLCPFCSNPGPFSIRRNGQTWCSVCGAEGPDMRANYDWLSRPVEDSLREESKELRDLVDNIDRAILGWKDEFNL